MIYGPQKGAGTSELKYLEQLMTCYADAVTLAVGLSYADEPGSGAAGGTGFALRSFLDASLRSGFDILSDVVQLRDKVRQVDLVITGEGKMDHQTGYGKAPSRLMDLARSMGKPVIAIVGMLEPGAGSEYDAVYALSDLAPNVEDARANADKWVGIAMDQCLSRLHIT